MKKIFIDTNIIIDLLAKREEFYQEAALLFTLAENRKIHLSISALSIANTSYILQKRLGKQQTKYILNKLLSLVNILSLDEKIIRHAIEDNDFGDFEDCLQYFTAYDNDQDIIISRNLKDYKFSKLPVMTSSQFLALIESH